VQNSCQDSSLVATHLILKDFVNASLVLNPRRSRPSRARIVREGQLRFPFNEAETENSFLISGHKSLSFHWLWYAVTPQKAMARQLPKAKNQKIAHRRICGCFQRVVVLMNPHGKATSG
jgi:hypothetical protein